MKGWYVLHSNIRFTGRASWQNTGLFAGQYRMISNPPNTFGPNAGVLFALDAKERKHGGRFRAFHLLLVADNAFRHALQNHE